MANILIVDDEAIISMQLEERLSALGYTISGMAATGEDAIEKARRMKPDCVLMDIVMPGKMNGIEAAKVISDEMDIPVVFVTSYADDAIVAQAKSVRPYGYIVKPFNELEIKAAIEVALYRKTAERREQVQREMPVGSPGSTRADIPDSETVEPGELPEINALLLKEMFSDIILFLYTEQAEKEPVFKFAIDEGIKKGGRNLYAYYRSMLPKFYPKEIQRKDLVTQRIKKHEMHKLVETFDLCSQVAPDPSNPLHIFLDFSAPDDFEEVLAFKESILDKKRKGYPISGMIAFDVGNIEPAHIASISAGISRIILATGKDTTISFANHSFPAESVSVVPQATIDEVVKKSLEPVVLSLLEKPMSGYDIVREINDRYNVLIPQARIYTILYSLQAEGYLEMKVSGKSKLYSPTEKGSKYIKRKLNEFKFVFQHILGPEAPARSE